LFVNSTGELVGIGNSAPENQLQISSDVGGVQRGLVISQHSENVATPIFLMKKSRGTHNNPSNINGGEYLGSVFGGGYVDDEYQLYGGFGWATRSGSVSGDNVQTDLVFTASETPISSVTSDEKMRLTYEGYLGIGTSDPNNALTVFDDISGKSGFEYAQVGISALNDNENAFINFNTTRGTTDRHWGIGVGEAGSELQNFRIYDWTADEDRLNIDINGRVGIGTQTPSQELNVIGDANFTGDVIIEGTLVGGSPLKFDKDPGVGYTTICVWDENGYWNLIYWKNGQQKVAKDTTRCG